MKFSWKGLAIAIGLTILVFSNVLTGFYVFVNIINWKVSFLNINPSEPPNERNFPIMNYPPSTGPGFEINENTIIFENIYLKYNGTPVENQPFELSVIGTTDPSIAQKINYVSFYFEGASPYPANSGTFSGSWGTALYPRNATGGIPVFLGAYLLDNPTVITWQVQGDYYPSITIHFKNFTDTTQSYAAYPDFRMHIESADVLKQQNSDRVNTSVSIALAFFGFVDGSVLVGRFLLTKKKKRPRKPKPNDLGKTNDNSNQQPTSKPKSQPKKSQPHHKIQRDKSKTLEQGKSQRKTEEVRPEEDKPKS